MIGLVIPLLLIIAGLTVTLISVHHGNKVEREDRDLVEEHLRKENQRFIDERRAAYARNDSLHAELAQQDAHMEILVEKLEALRVDLVLAALLFDTTGEWPSLFPLHNPAEWL